MKTCPKCGVVVKNNAVLFCPECSAEIYYEDVLPEDAGQEEPKQNNTELFVKIAFVGFVVAVIVSACAVVAFML